MLWGWGLAPDCRVARRVARAGHGLFAVVRGTFIPIQAGDRD